MQASLGLHTAVLHARVRAIMGRRRGGPTDSSGKQLHERHGFVERGRLDRRDRCRNPDSVSGGWRACHHQAQRRGPRTSQGPLRSVLRRNVGAFLLLRHARPAGALSRQALALFRWRSEPDLRGLYQPRLHHPGARRLARRQVSRSAQGRAVRRRPADGGALLHGVRGRWVGLCQRSRAQHLLAGAGADHRRIGLPEGQYLGDRRPALSAHRRAPRLGLHDLLHRD